MQWLALLAVAGFLVSSQSDPRIVPLYAVSPAVFQTGLTSDVQLTVLNANPNSTQQIQPGDKFTFTINIAGGSLVNLGAAIAAGFAPSSFSSSLSADGTQVVLTYNGPATLFGQGASFGITASLQLMQATSGFVTLQAPSTGYLTPQSFAASVSGVSFATQSVSDRGGAPLFIRRGPPGPTGATGATGPTGVTGSGGGDRSHRYRWAARANRSFGSTGGSWDRFSGSAWTYRPYGTGRE